MHTCQEKNLINFMNKHRINSDKSEERTHQSWGSNLCGVFHIPDNEIKQFMTLYKNSMVNNKSKFSIVEIQKRYSPIIVDIDLNIDESLVPDNYTSNKHFYDLDLIKSVVKTYYDIFKKHVRYNSEKFTCCVMEKPETNYKNNKYKDGFHMIFPRSCLSTKERYFIRNEAIKELTEKKIFAEFNEDLNVIIDSSVVNRNGWFLYGACKPDREPYEITHIFNDRLEEVTLEMNYIDYLSIRGSPSRYIENKKNEFINKKTVLELKENNYIDNEEINTVNQDLIDLTDNISVFIDLLSVQRATNYESWRDVGLALNSSGDFIELWLQFSAKCPEKYNEKEAIKAWKSFTVSHKKNLLTVRSLAFWAKIDDPVKYNKFIQSIRDTTRRRNLADDNYTIAKAFYDKYFDVYVCSAIKANTWWVFENHRWSRQEEGYKIKNALNCFADEYRNDINYYNEKARADPINSSKWDAYSKQCIGIIKKIKNNKTGIMEELKTLFFDEKFEQNLNSNIHLIGFSNGVYDLYHKKFRIGSPDDYISFSTKVEYIEYNKDNNYAKKIEKFFKQILPDDDVREYFLRILSTCVSGSIKEEKMYILNGCGSNGKSLLMDLVHNAMGDYFMACPISVITKNRGKSNEASPEKVRMIGKRCGVFQETDDGEKLNVGIMKEITGGDKILCRDLYKGSNEMIEFIPQIKYFLTCNQLPEVPSNDDGTWRRIRVIEFNSRFVDNPTKPNEFKININLKSEIVKWKTYLWDI